MLGPLLLATFLAPQDYDLGTPVPMDYSDEIARAQGEAEPLGVAIQIVAADGSTTSGAGFVVGRSDSELEILTSSELVRPASGAGYRVRLTGSDDWIDAGADSIRVLDSGIAFLRLPSAEVPLGVEAPFARIVPAVAASARIGAPAFILTIDASGQPTWFEGKIRTRKEGILDIRLPEASPELVGAAVLTRNFEYMAQVLSTGPDGVNALHYSAVSLAADTDGALFAIEPEPVHKAIVQALQGQRFATLIVRTANTQGRVYYRWYAIRISGQDGLFFSGSVWGLQRRASFQIDWSKTGLTITFPHLDVPLRKAPDYRLLDEQPLDGFIAFEASTKHMQAWLTLPTGDDQLLGTLLHTSKSRRDGLSFLDRHARRALSGFVGSPRMVAVDGTEPPYPFLIPFASEGPPASLRLPYELAEAGGRIEGFFALTDGHEDTKGKGRTRILRYELSFRDPQKEEPLATFRFAEDAYRLPFEVKIPPGTAEIEWSMRGRRVGPALAVLEAATVRLD